ncbi:peptidoglycan editing factor PgeF [Sunxiuqinia sp. A32]|uniref:peptidoglycan editing factor PgeF n=1 Tax=Sunxiuqinia sp. A32 TaxID=3461496 RepID=UPI0040463A96
MRKTELNGKLFYQFEIFNSIALINFCSTKIGWEENGSVRFTGDFEDDYIPFRKELASALNLQLDQLILPRQNHGTGIQVVQESSPLADVSETDALITNNPNLCICVQTADCVPVLLHDPKQNVIAAVHSGWRGTVNKILTKTIEKMHDQFGTNPQDIVAGIGPSISKNHYEIGAEVIYQVKQTFPNSSDLLFQMGNGKAHLNLWEANRSLLIEAGVDSKRIELSGLCSYALLELFYSARRDGAATGRMVSGIMLNKTETH